MRIWMQVNILCLYVLALGGATSERRWWGGEVFHGHALLKRFKCCVECSVHFLFIFLSSPFGMSLRTNFSDVKYYRLGGHGPWPPLGSPLALSSGEKFASKPTSYKKRAFCLHRKFV